jgi:hypothetical protein
MRKITPKRLREIITEEISLLKEGGEEVKAVEDLFRVIRPLLQAIESFNEKAPEKVKASGCGSNSTLQACLQEIETTLNRISDSPKVHIDSVKPKVKKVVLKPENVM